MKRSLRKNYHFIFATAIVMIFLLLVMNLIAIIISSNYNANAFLEAPKNNVFDTSDIENEYSEQTVVLSMPTDLSIDASLKLSWQEVDNAINYKVYIFWQSQTIVSNTQVLYYDLFEHILYLMFNHGFYYNMPLEIGVMAIAENTLLNSSLSPIILTLKDDYSIVYHIPATSHTITIAGFTITDGTVTSSHDTAIEGIEVTITATPEYGFEVNNVSISVGLIIDNGNYTWTFIMPNEAVIITVTFVAKTVTPSFTALENAIYNAGNRDEYNYSITTWTPFYLALHTALDALNDDALIQNEIDKITTTLTNATNALFSIATLRELIQYANDIINYYSSDYTCESIDNLIDAIVIATNARVTIVTANDLTTAITLLQQTIDSLESYPNFSMLKVAISRADIDNRVKTNYTITSWDIFYARLADAVLAKLEATTQSAVNSATNDLNSAIDNLIYIRGLFKLIAYAQNIVDNLYDNFTPESIIYLKSTIVVANNFLTAISQNIIENAIYSLQNAINKLESIITMPLSTPSNIWLDGNILRWNGVDNAIAFEVSINGHIFDAFGNPTVNFIDISSHNDFDLGATLTISIIAIAIDINYNSAPGIEIISIPLDFTALESLVALVEDYELESNIWYVIGALEAFRSALILAQELLLTQNEVLTQQPINDVFNMLQEAFKALDESINQLNFANLHLAISEAQALLDPQKNPPHNYKLGYILIIKEALDFALGVVNTHTTKEALNTAYTNLRTALTLTQANKIPNNVCLKDLIKLIRIAENKLYDYENYTTNSFTEFIVMLEMATRMWHFPSSLQSKINTARQNLYDALDNLVYLVELKNELIRVVTHLETYNHRYTQDSVESLQIAIVLAEIVLDNNYTTHSIVSATLLALENAFNALTIATINTADLDALIIKTQNLLNNYTNHFTADNISTLAFALGLAQETRTALESQPHIDAGFMILQYALENLMLVANLSELQVLVNYVDSYLYVSTNRYDMFRLATLQQYLQTAQTLLASAVEYKLISPISQTEVYTALDHLQTAFDNILPALNFSLLENKIIEATDYSKNPNNWYNIDAWTIFIETLATAQTLLNSEISTTQHNINVILEKLENTFIALGNNVLIFESLRNLISNAEAVLMNAEFNLTQNFRDTLQLAIDNANSILDTHSTTTKITDLYNALNALYNNPQSYVIVDTEYLDNIIKYANAIILQHATNREFTQESIDRLLDAYNLAIALLSSDYTQTEVDLMIVFLSDRIDSLVSITPLDNYRTTLNKLITTVTTYLENPYILYIYTATSVATLDFILSFAKSQYTHATTIEALELVRISLYNAFNNLIRIELYTEELEQLIDLVEQLILPNNILEANSYKALNIALYLAKTALDNSITQTQIDNAVLALQTAKDTRQEVLNYNDLYLLINDLENYLIENPNRYTLLSKQNLLDRIFEARMLITSGQYRAKLQANIIDAYEAVNSAYKALEKITFEIAVIILNNIGGSANFSPTAIEGQNIEITLSASHGYIFYNWTNLYGLTDYTINNNGNLSFIMPNQNVILVIEFRLNPPLPIYYAITAIGEGITMNLTQAIAGTIVTITINPPSGQVFDGWGTLVGITASIITPHLTQSNRFTFIMPGNNVSIAVIFRYIIIEEPNFEELANLIYKIENWLLDYKPLLPLELRLAVLSVLNDANDILENSQATQAEINTIYGALTSIFDTLKDYIDNHNNETDTSSSETSTNDNYEEGLSLLIIIVIFAGSCLLFVLILVATSLFVAKKHGKRKKVNYTNIEEFTNVDKLSKYRNKARKALNTAFYELQKAKELTSRHTRNPQNEELEEDALTQLDILDDSMKKAKQSIEEFLECKNRMQKPDYYE